MPKNGWFYSHDQNFDMETEAYRKINDYPHMKHLDDQLKLFIFFTKLKNDKRVNSLMNVVNI